MEYPLYISFLFLIFLGFFCSSQAYIFYAGGKNGWILKPSESYNHWAERNRFQVNDTIVFNYKKDHDSVLIVHKDDYIKCKKDKPIHALKNGHSKFKFPKSGPFYFISGHANNCKNGQKLIVVVLSPNHNKTSIETTSPSSAPAPTKSAAASIGSSGLFWFFSLIMAAIFSSLV
ncbi:early nodulin-like protein 3 [Nicotiana sylvestris]|uniref:Early nodulin-like protein 1 n=1 Tax=Nicotiana sylvestris TaxID=4096 RepID=A0A1U7UZS9_NICSY|nr:PREDICTED: early nodulin-like protein 1 [Nicotiana sylvestris]